MMMMTMMRTVSWYREMLMCYLRIVASPPKSPKKGKEEKSVGKGKKTDVELTVEEQKGPLPPHPGSDDWQFVERPIDLVHTSRFLL